MKVKTLLVKAEVRYWEDSVINGVSDDENGTLVPCKIDNFWCPEIDVETGVIINWEKLKTAEIHYKVCDFCGFEIKDDLANILHSKKDGYVPDSLCPKEQGDGDYIIMDIDSDGKIVDWKFNLKDFIQ